MYTHFNNEYNVQIVLQRRTEKNIYKIVCISVYKYSTQPFNRALKTQIHTPIESP